jgi:predicted  nucleic acid-binding Zn-ribbon protein
MDSQYHELPYSRNPELPYPQPLEFNYGSVHERCEHCLDTVLVSLANGYVEHIRMWKCCQCGFAENRESLQAACSNCNFASFQDNYAFQDISPYLCDMNDRPYDDENLETSQVVCIPAPATYPSNAADDFTSAILQNASRLEELMASDRSGPLFPDDRNDSIEEIPIALDPDHTHFDFTLLAPDCNSGYDIPLVHQTMDYNFTHNHDNSVTASSASEETTMFKVSILEDYSSLREGDSGYGSHIREDNRLEGSRKRPRVNLDDRSATMIQPDDSMSRLSKKRRSRLDPINPTKPRLACPFYKRNRRLCRYDSCAGPGSDSIHRLKQHLARVHLYHQCDRCGLVFSGDMPAKELKQHVRSEESCHLQEPKPAVWGMSQQNFDSLRSKRWPQSMGEEERWRDIYYLVVPGVDSEEKPSPCKISLRI